MSNALTTGGFLMQWESLDQIFKETAEKNPEKSAVLSDSLFVDYSSLDDGVDFLAEAVADAGVSAGDRVGVYIRSGYEFLITVLALSRLGAVPALLDILDDPAVSGRITAEAELASVITHGPDAALAAEVFTGEEEPGAVPGAPDFALVLREPSAAAETGDAGIIFFESEDRKPVFVPDETILAHMEDIAESLDLSARDIVAVTEPMITRESISLGFSAFLAGGGLSFGRIPHLTDSTRTRVAGSSPVTVLDLARRRLRPLGTSGTSGAAVPLRPRLRAIVGGDELTPGGCAQGLGTARHDPSRHAADDTARMRIHTIDLSAGRTRADHTVTLSKRLD
ncbi:AMP-binding protein [Streptomyces sp. NPDC014684]|uniref:AMP-binding protein n=1 Tax=Streptomyces sp. NPDC014684 TaxID=3364880 RepID=UPI003701AE17